MPSFIWGVSLWEAPLCCRRGFQTFGNALFMGSSESVPAEFRTLGTFWVAAKKV